MSTKSSERASAYEPRKLRVTQVNQRVCRKQLIGVSSTEYQAGLYHETGSRWAQGAQGGTKWHELVQFIHFATWKDRGDAPLTHRLNRQAGTASRASWRTIVNCESDKTAVF